MSSQRTWRVAALAAATMILALLVQAPAQAAVPQSRVVSSVPSKLTPNVNDGNVYTIATQAGHIFLGGDFTNATSVDSTTATPTANILSFDPATGDIDPGFATQLDGEVDQIIPGAGNTIYVTGLFKTVNGKSMRVARLDATTGAIVAGWKPPSMSAAPETLALDGDTLYVGGGFTKVGGLTHAGLAALNSTTGALLPWLQVDVANHHGTGSATGPVGPKKFDLSADGTHLVAIGNFTSVTDATGTYSRDQVLLVNLATSVGDRRPTLEPPRSTPRSASTGPSTPTSATCSSPPTAATSLSSPPAAAAPTPTHPLAVRLRARAGTTPARHRRSADLGRLHRPGLAVVGRRDRHGDLCRRSPALDEQLQRLRLRRRRSRAASGSGGARPGQRPAAGLEPGPQPTRRRRLRPAGHLDRPVRRVDTDYIGNHNIKHQKDRLLPAGRWHQRRRETTGALPGTVFETGQFANAHPEVLYRVDAAGPALPATDGGPDWQADTTDPRRTATPAATPPATARGQRRHTVPASTPSAIFNTRALGSGQPERRRRDALGLPGARRHDGAGPALLRQPLHRHQRRGPAGLRRRRGRDHHAAELRHRGRRRRPDRHHARVQRDQPRRRHHRLDARGREPADQRHRDRPDRPGPPAAHHRRRAALPARWTPPATSAPPATADNGSVLPWSQVARRVRRRQPMLSGLQRRQLPQADITGTTFGPQVAVDPYDDPAVGRADRLRSDLRRASSPTTTASSPRHVGVLLRRTDVLHAVRLQSQMHYRYFTPDSGIVGSGRVQDHRRPGLEGHRRRVRQWREPLLRHVATACCTRSPGSAARPPVRPRPWTRR